MSRLVAAFTELLGLFVDDWPFTLGIVVWLAVCGLALAPIVESLQLRAGLLLVGLLAVLLASVWSTSRRKKLSS